jgi:hypothetical protein
VPIGAGDDKRERGATAVHQQAAARKTSALACR